MRIGIIGGGAIGLLTASYLAEHHHITLYVRRERQKEQLKEQGISLYSSSEYKKTSHIPCKHLIDLEQADCYLVCVKQTHMEKVFPFLQTVNPDTPILFLQNGMGHLPYLTHLGQASFLGVVEHGAKRLSDTEVNHLGKGTIKVASFHHMWLETQQVINQLHQVTFPFEAKENYKEMLQEKLIINAVINPLTALFRVKNGCIIDREPICKLASELCDETASVLQMDLDWAWETVKETAMATAGNTSSMLADILAGRQTEIEAISGYIMKQAKQEVPYTTFVYQALLELEKRGDTNDKTY